MLLRGVILDGNNVRFFQGKPEKIGGWEKLTQKHRDRGLPQGLRLGLQ